jgi:hypothetical protein
MTGTDKQIYQRLFEEYRDDVMEHNKLVKKQLAKKKRQAEREQKKLKEITDNVIELKEDIKNQLYEIVKTDVKTNKPFKVTIINMNQQVIFEKDYNFGGRSLGDAWSEVHHDMLIESPEKYYWDEIQCKVFITFGEKPIKSDKIIQAFFEGTINCVMMPIIRFLEEKINTSNKWNIALKLGSFAEFSSL